MSATLRQIGLWSASVEPPCFAAEQLVEAVQRVREPVSLIQDPNAARVGVGFGGVSRY